MNYVALVVAAIFNMVLGFLWYGPVFGKPWMKYMGITKEQMAKAKKKQGEMMGKYFLLLISSFIQAYVMSWFIGMTGAMGWTAGAMLGGMAWLGYAATVQFAGWNFSGKKVGLFLIDTGYFLVSFVVFGIILASWR